MTTLEPPIAVSMMRCVRVWKSAGHAVLEAAGFGDAGFVLTLGDRGSVIVTQAPWEDGEDWIHTSLAWYDHMPTYEDMTVLHQSVFGPNRTSYQVFAAQSRHVNIHKYALHLWGRTDGKMLLPDFGREGTI